MATNYCEGQFDAIKIGVCDIYWTPQCGFGSEVYLGLTKGGVELTYTPEYYDLTVDQYGNTPVDSVLIGEAVSVKIPLAETDLNKLSMFAPTATVKTTAGGVINGVTFGQRPGLRLSKRAGVLRFHPVALGNDNSEDVIIYRAVNKGALQLNYKMNAETLYELDVVALIDRNRTNGSMLFEIGDPTTVEPPITSDDIPNLPNFTEDYNINVVPSQTDLTTQASVNHSVAFVVNCIYNYQVYNVTGSCTFAFIGGAVGPASTLLDTAGGFIDLVTGVKSATSYEVTAVDTSDLHNGTDFTGTYNGTVINEGDAISITLRVTFGSKNQNVSITVRVSNL